MGFNFKDGSLFGQAFSFSSPRIFNGKRSKLVLFEVNFTNIRCFKVYNETEILKAKLDILSKTNMIDYVIDIRKLLYPDEDVPEDLKQRRFHVVAQLQELQQEVKPILEIMGDEEVMKNMENMRDSKTLINYLSKDYKVNY